MNSSIEYSEEVSKKIDHEVSKIMSEAYERAWQTVQDNRKALDAIANRLVETETIEREEFEKILSEKDCWHESGEGCGTDMFICKVAPKKRPEDMTHEDFVRILQDKVLVDLKPADYLAIPGMFEILSEYYNNDVITEWEEED
jgi:hypothetical protein